jgi:glycosyltransferase involved in cell wall biosynthesis
VAALHGRATVVSPDPAAQWAGLERVCRDVARALSERFWDTQVVGPEVAPAQWLSRIGGGPLSLARSASAAVRRSNPDLLVTTNYLGAFSPPDVPRIHHFQNVMVFHALYGDVLVPTGERLRRAVGSFPAEMLAARNATVVACSEAIADELRSVYRIAPDAIVPNAVDTSIYHPRRQDEARERLGLDRAANYGLFVGRHEGRKGIDIVLPACVEAGLQLVVVSDERVPGAINLGTLAPAECAWAYCAADFVLFPTRYEGCSILVLEVLASGVPLLTTSVGWTKTFLREVPEYRDLIVRPDASDVAARLRALRGADLTDVTEAAREFVARECSFEAFANRWGDLADRVVQG